MASRCFCRLLVDTTDRTGSICAGRAAQGGGRPRSAIFGQSNANLETLTVRDTEAGRKCLLADASLKARRWPPMNKWWVRCAVEEGQKYLHNLVSHEPFI